MTILYYNGLVKKLTRQYKNQGKLKSEETEENYKQKQHFFNGVIHGF
jgi:hypothetical protein